MSLKDRQNHFQTKVWDMAYKSRRIKLNLQIPGVAPRDSIIIEIADRLQDNYFN